MYKVTFINGAEETAVLYPAADKNGYRLLKAELDQKLGEAHSLTLDVPVGNPGYNAINDLITKVQVLNTHTNTLVFEGRIYNTQEELSSDSKLYKECVCESELAYLNDTRVRAWVITSINCHDLMQKVIDNHNAHTTADKYFTLGRVDFDDTVDIQSKFENSLNFLIDSMVNTVGNGYLVVRKENNTRYLDYVKTLDIQNDDIRVSKNLKDYAFAKDMENIATRVIPVGKDNLTIESVNNGLDYLVNTKIENELGIVVEQTLDLNDIDDAQTLMNTAKDKLDSMGKATYKLTADSLDLSTLKIDPYGQNIGGTSNVICTTVNFNQAFTIIEKDFDLLNAQDCKLTFDNKIDNRTNKEIQLQRVAQYISNLLTNTKQLNTFYLDGYINLLKNQMGAMADCAEKQNAKCILFEDKQEDSKTFGAMALGTKGFMIADTLLENGEWDWRTFGTGKGFTADLIVAGTMLADFIKGGTLSSKDDSLKINLDSGHFTLMVNALKALDLYGNNIEFHDFLGDGSTVGLISSTRRIDSQGNTTGTPGISAGVPNGCVFTIGRISKNNDETYSFKNDFIWDYSDSNNPHIDVNIPIFLNDKTNIYKASDGSITQDGDVTIDGMKTTFHNGLITGLQKTS